MAPAEIPKGPPDDDNGLLILSLGITYWPRLM